MKSVKYLCFFLALLLALAGCSDNEPQNAAVPQEHSSGEVLEEADPQGALDEIYKTIDMKGLEDADDTVLTEKFFIDTSKLEEYYVKYSSGRYGVADVFILKASPEDTPSIRESLEQVKLNRMKEFENYDIHNSYGIAQNAQVFEQGGYVIMLMLEDLDGAREIIDRYIP
ncbi:DUF4358 domain-containing protein [Youxingia wuxianensis]|uniref:DUF4358 domain-containing protein n=1 Tax=Youxingia wuxianensis TaxID=2763678 RepID=A0A926ET59_9FIRM|nr:DUF4358 domain-containing protein [Youxingia wuxianensis]MBC8585894.1 DUF4358 domain-containing protein [Youxingia wuxianensis]